MDFRNRLVTVRLTRDEHNAVQNHLKGLNVSISSFVRNLIVTEVKRSPVVSRSSIGKNAPCPCGSGKKYKKCCLNKEL